MGFPSPNSTQLVGWGSGVVSHIQAAALVSFAPGNVTGTCLPTPGPLTAGAATSGVIAGLSGPAMASLVQAAAGYPSVSAELTAFCTEIANHVMSAGTVDFSTGTVNGACTNTPITPGTFTGTGVGGTISGMSGSTLADNVHAAAGYPGSTSPELVDFCTAIVTYIEANATVAGGVMSGVAPAGGGSITAGTGAGGTIA